MSTSEVRQSVVTRVERIDLYRYVCPVHAGRSHLPSRAVVARIRAEGSSVNGIGEAFVVADQADAAWQHATELASGLVGATLPNIQRDDASLHDLPGWRPVVATDRGPRRSAKLALELALLDLLMKVGGQTPARFWGTEQQQAPIATPIRRKLPEALPEESDWDVELEAEADEEPSRVVKLQLNGDVTIDTAWLRRLAEADARAGRDRLYWLSGLDLDRAGAEAFVERLAAQMADGRAPSQVLLDEPIAVGAPSLLTKLRGRLLPPALQGRSPLSRLQQLADGAFGARSAASTNRPRLSIMASEGIGTMRQVDRLSRRRPVGGLYLSLPHWGSLQGLREAARRAKQADPSMLIVLGGARGSQITSLALEAVAAATPEIDMYVPEPLSSRWPKLALSPADVGVEGGFFADLDVSELSKFADRACSVPAVENNPRLDNLNEYTNHPLHHAPSGLLRSLLLETEALRAGLRTRRFDRGFFFMDDGDRTPTGFTASEPATTSAAASVLTTDKTATQTLLAAQGLPVPRGVAVSGSQRKEAYAAGMELGFPLVVKPAGGSKGVGVTTAITTADELSDAIDLAADSKYGETGIIVERFVTGHDYRVVATRDEVLSVIYREPAAVTGDGIHTVEELVLFTNIVRRKNPHLGGRLLIPMDERADLPLRRQGLHRRSVPPEGQRIQLSTVANVSMGGNSHEVMDSTHPTILELAANAVAAIPDLAFGGVDLLMEDHRLPADEQDVTIIEVNPKPVQTMHHFPMYGPPRDLSGRMVREAAVAAGLHVQPPSDVLSIEVTVSGKVRNIGYRAWMQRTARQLGVSGWVANVGDHGEVQALLQGSPFLVGLMLRLALSGPQAAHVQEVYAVPVKPRRVGRFVVRG